MKSLGGSIIVRNAVEFDYCVVEAATSLAAVCDDVVVLDCRSTDGTLDLLRDAQQRLPNLRVVEGGDWNCADNYVRLSLLTDVAKSHLSTDWHFCLQADEVLHEDDFPNIRAAVAQGLWDSFMNRRINFFGDLYHYIRFDAPDEHKPVSDVIFRLAHIKYGSHNDAETMKVDPATTSGEYLDGIRIFHYGFVRDNFKHVDKILSMQSWFWGPGSVPDGRAIRAKERGVAFDWREFKTRDLLDRFTGTHPKFAREWVESRQARKEPVA